MGKTYGKLARGAYDDRRVFGIRSVPHVAQKLKRVFPRADQTQPGVVMLTDTAEVARDLEWFMQRWPLETDTDTLAYLAARAEEHRAAEEAVTAILDGYMPPREYREPAVRPRDYQLVADAVAAATGRLLNTDELGLGKTFSALLRLRDPDALPALVVAPVHLCRQWLAEMNKTLPWLTGHIVVKGQPYDVSARRDMSGRQPDVLIISYAKLAGWADHLAGDIRTVIFDEVQELHTGQGTAKWASAAQIAWKAAYRIGLSATPIANYGGEAWNILRVLDPEVLGTETEFVREWCGVPNGMGKHNSLANPAQFGHYLRDTGVMLRRTRAELHRELPNPIQVEQPVDVDHASIDEVAAQCEKQARILVGEIEADYTARGRAALEIDWRMRQVTGVAKAPAVAQFAKLILESESRVVMWAWHREVYDILLEQLADYLPVMYTGSESPAAKAKNAKAFCGGDSRVLLMSLRSGAGLDGLQKWCSVGVFSELDWSPAVHAQCIGRLNRDGQDSTVMAYFMTSDDGTDPLMCEVLGIKRQQSEPVINPDAALFATLTPQTDRARQLSADVLARVARTGRRR